MPEEILILCAGGFGVALIIFSLLARKLPRDPPPGERREAPDSATAVESASKGQLSQARSTPLVLPVPPKNKMLEPAAVKTERQAVAEAEPVATAEAAEEVPQLPSEVRTRISTLNQRLDRLEDSIEDLEVRLQEFAFALNPPARLTAAADIDIDHAVEHSDTIAA